MHNYGRGLAAITAGNAALPHNLVTEASAQGYFACMALVASQPAPGGATR